MSSFDSYDRDSFRTEFFPDQADRAAMEADAAELVKVSRAARLAETRAVTPEMAHAQLTN